MVISVSGVAEPMDIVLVVGLSQGKIPMTPAGIETATFCLVAQCVSQLCHYVTQSP